jgi:hypothetical protein
MWPARVNRGPLSWSTGSNASPPSTNASCLASTPNGTSLRRNATTRCAQPQGTVCPIRAGKPSQSPRLPPQPRRGPRTPSEIACWRGKTCALPAFLWVGLASAVDTRREIATQLRRNRTSDPRRPKVRGSVEPAFQRGARGGDQPRSPLRGYCAGYAVGARDDTPDRGGERCSWQRRRSRISTAS